MLDKGDILFIQYKISLRKPKSVRKVSVLSLIFIYFYILALIQRLSNNETSLQLSENITFFTICRMYTVVISKGTKIDTSCYGRIIYIYLEYIYCTM
jgi:hypothetical protein